MPYTKGIVHFDDTDMQGRQSPDVWLRIYHSPPKLHRNRWWVKGAIAETQVTSTNDFMWDDWYIVKRYGATQPGREKSEPGKETGWVLLQMRNGRMEYFSWTKHRRMTTNTPIEKTKMPNGAIIPKKAFWPNKVAIAEKTKMPEHAINPKKAAIAEKTKRINCCRDPIKHGLFTTIY